ncbi:hypothetical protein F2P79_025775 [Pimephales promelas]|nr:hypothetical protein F2P79_025775 [Pimephales promelas]
MRMISRCNIGDIVISDHAIVVLDVSVKGFLRPARNAEKAFDSVEWPYLFFTLEKFGLGEFFIKWVRTLYKDPLSAVITNGRRSDHFSLFRGTRQGCPLSPLLFAIAMEPFAQRIRESDAVSGISLGDR